MTWVHFAFYLGSLGLAGIWSFCLIVDARNRTPRPPLIRPHVHTWELVEDYGHVRKCRCQACRKIALVRVIRLPGS